MSHKWDTDSAHSDSSFDEDEVNTRVINPNWTKYRHIIEHGRLYRLDTCRDVREHYEQYCADLLSGLSGYSRACGVSDDGPLCKDVGLVSGYMNIHQVSGLIGHLSQIVYSVVPESLMEPR
jgi:hypothetical protein